MSLSQIWMVPIYFAAVLCQKKKKKLTKLCKWTAQSSAHFSKRSNYLEIGTLPGSSSSKVFITRRRVCVPAPKQQMMTMTFLFKTTRR